MGESIVSVILGSNSDIPIFKGIKDTLEYFKVPYEKRIISAHRTPDILSDYVRDAESRGIKVFIAVAGMSAALPGVVSSLTTLPVIGVPAYKEDSPFGGMDALLSVVQMPPGIPVASVAVNGGKNAAILAVRILSIGNDVYREKLVNFMKDQKKAVIEKDEEFRKS